MDEAGGFAHIFGQRRQEGDNVVFDLAFDLVDAFDVEIAFFPYGLGGLFRRITSYNVCYTKLLRGARQDSRAPRARQLRYWLRRARLDAGTDRELCCAGLACPPRRMVHR